MKKQKKLQVPSIIASVMVIMTLLISVGYSAFNTKLNVKDIKAVVRVEKDIRVTNVTAQGDNSGVSNWEDYNVSNISGSVRLPNANSTVTYKVEITNIGNVEVGIFKYIAEGLPADLTYETIFPEKSKICDNLSTIKCTMGAKRTIDIVIKYKDGKYNATTATKDYTFNLGFDFRTYHKITYKNITSATTTNLPTEILDGDTLNIDIGTGYTLNITQDGKALASNQYTYSNGRLIIHNITGDLKITVNSFATDSWQTIKENVDTGVYNVGDEREITFGVNGNIKTFTLRLANTSTPKECNNKLNFSQTACGFVVEFKDFIGASIMNSKGTNNGGWPATELKQYLENEIYPSLPSDLQDVIINTISISGHGSADKGSGPEGNFITTNKLYLLSPHEVWANRLEYDTAYNYTRQLDYYANQGVTTANGSFAIKYRGNPSLPIRWWLSGAVSDTDDSFYLVDTDGFLERVQSFGAGGVAPAFRIGQN